MKNITYITYCEHTKLNQVIIKTKAIPLMSIYMIALLAFTLYGFIVKNYIIGIAGASIIVLFPLVSILYFKKKNKDSYNKYKEIYQDIHYEFEFKEDYLTVVLIQKGVKNELKTKYEELSSVIEAKDNIFIFIDSKRAYVVSIKGFENFDRVEFRSLVQTKVKRYKIIGK